MSRSTYHSIAGQEDPTGEEILILEDKVMMSPQVIALQAQIVEQGLGITDLRQQIAKMVAAMNPPVQQQPQSILGPDGQPLPPSQPLPQPIGGAVMVPQGSPQEAQSVNQGMGNLMGGG